MKLTQNKKMKPGMTLIELTVVILVLLTLISVLFIGAQAYKKGADRAACILNIRNAQQAMRSEMNVNEAKPGDTTLVETAVIGTNGYLEVAPVCPGGGSYSLGSLATTYPTLGTLWMPCSLTADADGKHRPKSNVGW